MTSNISATHIVTEKGVQYHLACKRGDLAENIMLVGDPDRAKLVADQFDTVTFHSQHREFVIFTGVYRGIEVTALSTGISQSNMEIAIIEACQITDQPTFIRCGSCGALQENMELGDLVISTGSVKIEDTTSFFAPPGYPAIAHSDCVIALLMASKELRDEHPSQTHVGLTASTSGFYGAQGRHVEGFPILNDQSLSQLSGLGVKNFEMETSTLFVLSQVRGVRAGAICAVYANRPRDVFADEITRKKSEKRCIEVSLKAFLNLYALDQKKDAGDVLWSPASIETL